MVLGSVVANRARLARAPANVARHVGWYLLPQAGVALGLRLLLTERFPEVGNAILSLLVGTTLLFEVLGPSATRTASANTIAPARGSRPVRTERNSTSQTASELDVRSKPLYTTDCHSFTYP